MNSTAQMEPLTDSHSPGDDLGLKELLSDLWRAKFLVLGAMFIFGAIGSGAGFLMKKQYEASVTISPALEDSGSARLGSLGALGSQYGGLASLAGINLPDKSRKDEAIAVLQSELLTRAYITQHNLMPVLYASKWDAQAKTWKPGNPKDQPTLWKANQFFKTKIRRVAEDRKSGMVVVTIRWTDANLAAEWANDLVRVTNEYLRAKAIKECERNIAFLNSQVVKTNIVEAQKALYALLQDEINKEMLARGRDEYALKVIDPAVPPEKASSLGKAALGIVGIMAGGFLAGLFIFTRRILFS